MNEEIGNNEYVYKILEENTTTDIIDGKEVIVKKVYIERVSKKRIEYKKEYMKEYMKEYYERNTDNIKEKNKETMKQKYQNDPEYRELVKAKRREYYLKNTQ